MEPFFITTPIYYVNDKPHIGHAYTTILADVLARYHRMLGCPTLFLTGTDEHGQKVEQAARQAGMTPQEQADRTVVRFQALWKKLEITHDDFIRTTEPRHVQAVQAVLQDLHDRGEIYRDTYDGWYCTPCERFFAEKDLVEKACPECRRPVERIEEANYFFRMSKYQSWLVDYIQEHPDFILPDFRRNETLGFLRKPLSDLCLSRPKSRLAWGIELPFDRDYVTYVWFDALLNYISAPGYGSDEERFRSWWPARMHLIGKDILTTHTVYWPTMLRAMGLPMPRTIFAHGWWLAGESKMSKSLGNVVDPMALADRYGVDSFRYYLMAEMSLGQDARFTEEAFVRRYNADLANDLGNLLSRVLKLMVRHCGGCIPDGNTGGGPADDDARELWKDVQRAVAAMEESVPSMHLDQGLAAVSAAMRSANRFLERSRPWDLAKREGDRHALARVLYTAAETLRVVASLLAPVMPGRMAALRTALGLPDEDPDFSRLHEWGRLEPGTPVSEPGALFPRIRLEEPPRPAAAVPAPPEPETISLEAFSRIDLRTAEVLTAERVPGADKLLRLEVRIGEETRPLVAGIAAAYTPEDLVGRTIVVVANLQPARIRGVESRGMLLAAKQDGRLALVTVDGDVEIGSGASVG